MAVIDWSDPNAVANGTFTINLGLESIDVTVTSVRVSDGSLVGDTAIFDGSPVLAPESGVSEPHSYTIDFGQDVDDIGFEIFDIDAGTPISNKGADPAGWDDVVTIIARDALGNIVTLDPSTVTANYSPTNEENVDGTEDVHEISTLSGDATYPDGALRIDATAYNSAGVEGSGALDTLRFDFPDGIASIEIIQENGSQSIDTGVINIGNINFQFSPGQDDVVEGTLGDDVIIAGGYVDEDGEEVDNLDSLGLVTSAPGTNEDRILGFEGDDFINAGLGDDYVDGGAGDDEIEGGGGADTLLGDLGSDIISGEAGDDIIDGGSRADTLDGGSGDDTIFGGTGADEIDGGDDNDTIDGGDGSDTVVGGSGDDIISDTGVESSVREALRWGELTSDETNVQSFILDTDENQVTFNVNSDISVGIQGEDDQTITTTGVITGGLPPASTTETLEFETNDVDDFAEVEFTFRFDAENVSFRIAELENDVEVTVLAYDRDGNLVDVSFTDVGSDITVDDNTLIADDGGENSTDPADSATVFIGGAIARLVIRIDNESSDTSDNATPNISDIFFDSIVSSDDVLSGGEGADTIRGGDGSDIISGDADDDDIFFGSGDIATGGSGDDVFAIDLTDADPDVVATIDGGSDGTGTGTPVEGDDDANGNDGDTLDLSNLTGDGNTEDGISGVTVTYGANPEDGTVTGVGGLEDGPDVTFTEIENIIYTGDDDLADASASTSSTDIATGGGDDVVTGGEADDNLDGGVDDDTIFMSEGSDTIAGGEGTDEYSAENSTALTDETITVTTDDAGSATIAKEGDGGTDTTTSIEVFTADEGQTGTSAIDEFTITGNFEETEITGVDRVNAVGTWESGNPAVGTISFGPGGPTLGEILDGLYDPGTGPVGPKGIVQITGGDESGQIGNIEFDNFEIINFSVVCFAKGTMIRTVGGDVLIETLQKGDMVVTADHGAQKIQWIGSTALDVTELRANPKLLPIRIRPGSLGDGIPSSDLIVSRQHRILVRSKIAERMFNEPEVLIPAIKLIDLPGIAIATDVQDVHYFHMLFEQHEIVLSNGALTESLFTGPEALKAVSSEAREEIVTLFPELDSENFEPVPARFIPRQGKSMKQLVARHQKNMKPLYVESAWN